MSALETKSNLHLFANCKIIIHCLEHTHFWQIGQMMSLVDRDSIAAHSDSSSNFFSCSYCKRIACSVVKKMEHTKIELYM